MILQRIQVPVPGKSSSATSSPLFNTLNFVIAVALAAVQAWSNMIFCSHLLQCHYRDHDRDARQADD